MACNVCSSFEIKFEYVHVVSLVVSLFLIFVFRGYKIKMRSFLFLFVIVALESFYKLYYDTTEGARHDTLQLCGTPILIYAYLKITDNGVVTDRYVRLWSKLTKIFFCFYLFLTLIAVYEGVVGHAVFGYQGDTSIFMTDDLSSYRSASIMGHPLQSSLVTSTIMAFILISPIKLKYKYALWGLFCSFIMPQWKKFYSWKCPSNDCIHSLHGFCAEKIVHE